MEDNIKSVLEMALKLIGEHIKERRKELGWTQIELSERAKVRIATISEIESGNVKDMKLSTLLAILGAMNKGEITFIEDNTMKKASIEDIINLLNLFEAKMRDSILKRANYEKRFYAELNPDLVELDLTNEIPPLSLILNEFKPKSPRL